jgi:hypothetical protein
MDFSIRGCQKPVVSNLSETLDDYAVEGDKVFSRFNAPKENVIANYRAVLEVLIDKLGMNGASANPLLCDLRTLAIDLAKIDAGTATKSVN